MHYFTLKKNIYTYIYFCFRSVGSRFDLGKSSLSHSVRRVVKALTSISAEVISWPRGDCLLSAKTKFQRISGLSNVVGAIDGSLIEIPAPKVKYFFVIQMFCLMYLITLVNFNL